MKSSIIINTTADTTAAQPQPRSSTEEILHDLRPLLIIYKDGRIQRLLGTSTVPPDPHSDTVPSKDVQISSTVSARLYLPPKSNHQTTTKLPLLIYFHGGAFVIESASSPTYHHYLTQLASKSSSLIVSVNYRLAPEHPLPAAYDDCWAAVQWAITTTTDPWITDHADLTKLYFAGDSAGGNIAHHMGIRFGKEILKAKQQQPGFAINLAGLVLVHPFFMMESTIHGDGGPATVTGREHGRRIWTVACGGGDEVSKTCVDHPWINPEMDEEEEGGLEMLMNGCEKVLVFVAEKDPLRNIGVYYAEEVIGKKWSGKKKSVEVVETKREGHVFHLLDGGCENAVKMMDKFVEFIQG